MRHPMYTATTILFLSMPLVLGSLWSFLIMLLYIPLIVKKYIDDHFHEPDLSLERLSAELQYNRTYLSATFKKAMGIGISTYMSQIRIQ
ncbi:MAG: AraC family transcriptional regulator, partial [Tidjanibacter sp.]|nr:AraC family transcriptional regulator [Tidjanibacter sp.]